MFREIILPTIFSILAYGFWISPDFKEIAAGVAIFLFGMLALEEGYKAFTGGVPEGILRKTTNRLWKSLSFGVISTTIMQSASTADCPWVIIKSDEKKRARINAIRHFLDRGDYDKGSGTRCSGQIA